MVIKGKRLLILGGAAQCCKVVETAKALGLYTIVADMSEKCPAKEIADEGIKYSLTDVDGLLSWCRENPVDGILNFCFDIAQNTHRILCEKLNFPVFGNKEQYDIFTDKRKFKDACIQNGLDVVHDYTIDRLDEIEYPVIVKPTNSCGSKGILKCENREELLENYKIAASESIGGKVIIEKYLENRQEFTLCYVVINGEPYLVRAMDRYLGDSDLQLDRQPICGVSPSAHSMDLIKEYDPLVKKMLKNVGLTFAPCQIQCFIDGDKIRFFDPALRFPGHDYEKVFKYVTGIDLMELFIKYSLGVQDDSVIYEDAYMLNNNCVVQLFVDLLPGRISKIDGLDEIKQMDYVVHILQKHDIGYMVPETNDVKRRVFEIDIVCPRDLQLISETIEAVKRKLVVLDSESKSMVTPFVDPQSIRI